MAARAGGPAEFDGPDLLRIAEAARWPLVRLGRLAIAGEAAWRAAVAGPVPLTPGERRSMLAGLGRRPELLCITEVGRARLRAWLNEPERRLPVGLSVVEVARHLHFFGDEALLPVVATAIAMLPRPVRDFAIAEPMFLAVGRSIGGQITARLPSRRPVLLCGAWGDDFTATTTRHEVAHGWTLPDLDIEAPTVARSIAGRQWLAERNLIAECDRLRLDDEFIADALAAAWGAAAELP